MNLKQSLTAVVISATIAAALGLVYIEHANRQRHNWRLTTQKTHQLAKSVSALESLAYEWILRPSNRPAQQWDLLQDKIRNLFQDIRLQHPDIKFNNSFNISLERANRLFKNIKQANWNSFENNQGNLIATLLVHTRELSLQADLLLTLSLKMQDESTRRDLFIFYLSVGLLCLFGCYLLIMMRQRILRPLTDIRSATYTLGTSLTSPPIPKRYNDEIGQLIDSFNEMVMHIGLLTKKIEHQTTVKAEEQLFFGMTEFQPQPVWTANQLGGIQWKNIAFKEHFGTEILDSLWTELVHPDDVVPLETIIKQASEQRHGSMIDCRLATNTGWRWFVVRTAPLKTTLQQNQPLWIYTAGDIHERRMAEERLQNSRQRAEVLNQISVTLTEELNPQQLTQLITQAACELLQGEFAKIHTDQDMDGNNPLKPYAETILTHEDKAFLAFNQLPDGLLPSSATLLSGTSDDKLLKETPLRTIGSIAIAPISLGDNGESRGHLIVAHRNVDFFNVDDLQLLISLSHIASAAIENAHLHATERAATRLADFRSRLLERSNNDLQEFAYVASHDLQEPLRMITSYLDVLHVRAADKIGQENIRFLERSTESAARMTRLVKDLLTYSRAGHEEDDKEIIDLIPLVREISEDISKLIEENHGEVTVGELPIVRARRILIRQVIMNLVQNAIKYRHPQRHPQIHISSTANTHETLIHIADNGLGIPDSHHERVFRLFQRLDRGAAEGSGIGLSICRKLVRSWGGEISVESNPQGGSTFTFTLPNNMSISSTPTGAFPAIRKL